MVYSWFVPFVTTPINIARESVKHSPLGFVGEKGVPFKGLGREEMAKAMGGSIVTAIGAMMAAAGQTTWMPPRDEEEKKMFYATGRKPLSVKIGNRWWPLWYFGPFSIALGLPAAIKYYHQDSPKVLTDSETEKLIEIAIGTSRFISSQTSLTGMGNFLSIIDGNEDMSKGGALGFTAGQIVPLGGMMRHINTMIDPIYRKAKGFGPGFLKNIPGMTKDMEPFLDPEGFPAERDKANYWLPYDIGKDNPYYEAAFQSRRVTVQYNKYNYELKKQLEAFK